MSLLGTSPANPKEHIMTDLQIEIVVDEKAQHVADDLHYQFRYYMEALADVKRSTEQAIENTAKGYRVDASWITNYANKAADYQREIETLVKISYFVGLTKEQIELAASDKKVWFQTAAEAAEYAAKENAK